VAFSTSGRSPNVLAAAKSAREKGMTVWSFTGPAPNPLAELSDDAVTVTAATPTVQEIHQIALHLLCAAFDRSLPCGDYPKPTGVDWPLPSGRGTGHEEGSDERDE
jgi:hypothetical protein